MREERRGVAGGTKASGLLPNHVAIIMDGNGRWARQRGLPRVAGHREGVLRAREAAELAARRGLKVLSLYAFSTENWRRPKDEVSFIMRLFEESVRREIPALTRNNILFRASGRLDELPAGVQAAIGDAVEATSGNSGLVLNIAVNYGGRAELVDAARALARAVQAGELSPEQIDEAELSRHLYTAGLPDPDLLIRPSGEMRLSNFFLWQAAYSELYVTKALWPDFRATEFEEALAAYKGRERRFGGLGAEVNP